MIRLTKQQKPSILEKNAKAWTNEVMTYVNNGQKVPEAIQNRYNHPEIKSSLTKETSGKCMYCESYIGSVAFSHIEHFRPKALYPEKTFEWENLGLGCPKCNTYKSDVFNEALPYVNPYFENPDNCFVFLGTMIKQKPGSARGENMINQLQLNRSELMERRRAAIDNISQLVERYVSTTDLAIKNMLRSNILIEMGPDKPYSRCVKSAVELLTDEKW